MMNQKNRANAHGSGLAWLRRVTAFVCTFAMLFSSCGPVLSGDTALAQYSEDYRVTSDPIYPTTPLPSLLPSATPEADPEATPIPDDYWDWQGGTLTASGDGWTATLTYRTEAKIPDGAVLTLTELKGADLYNAMKSAAALLKNDADEVWRRELSNEDNHFFTASITDPDGNTVQPQAAVALTWRNTNHDSEQTYFSFGDEASRIVESADGTMHFKPYLGESFGYGATDNIQIGTVTQVHEGSDYMVTASYGPEAGFPAGTELKVREIMPGTAEYATYSGMTDEALGEDWSEITLERYFDIAFVKDGKELEPQADIDVQISFSEKIELTEEHDVAAVHIENNEATVIETETESNEAAKYDSEAIDTVAFTSDSFSVYGVVQKKRIITKVLEAGGNTYEIELSYTQEAEIPENAQLIVEEIPEGSDLWEAYRIQTAAALKADDVRLPGLYDISIVDEAGEKVKPAIPVNIAIKLLNDDTTEDIQIVHFKEEMPQELVDEAAQQAEQAAQEQSSQPETQQPEEQKVEQSQEPAEEKTEEPTEVQAQPAEPSQTIESETITATVEGDTVTFEAGSFSVFAFAYTVDFYYTNDGQTVEYHIPGGTVQSLRALLPILGIVEDDPETEKDEVLAFLNEVESVSFSDESLVKVIRVDADITAGEIIDELGEEIIYSGNLDEETVADMRESKLTAPDWALVSLQPFLSEELLTITLKSGEVILVRVTDAQDPIVFTGRQIIIYDNTEKLAMTARWEQNQYRTELASVAEEDADSDETAHWTLEINNNAYYLKSYDGKYLKIDNQNIYLVGSQSEATPLSVQAGSNPDYRISDKNNYDNVLTYCKNNEWPGFFSAPGGSYGGNNNTNRWLYIREVSLTAKQFSVDVATWTSNGERWGQLNSKYFGTVDNHGIDGDRYPASGTRDGNLDTNNGKTYFKYGFGAVPKDGYQLAFWAYQENGLYRQIPAITNTTIIPHNPTNYYAYYTPAGKKLFIYQSEDTNMGTVSQQYAYSNSSTGSTANPKNGYQFLGWFDADNHLISRNQTISPSEPTKSMVLTAKFWDTNKPQKINIDVNNNSMGTVVDGDHNDYLGEKDLNNCRLQTTITAVSKDPSKYEFMYWTLDGAVMNNLGQTISPNADSSLYPGAELKAVFVEYQTYGSASGGTSGKTINNKNELKNWAESLNNDEIIQNADKTAKVKDYNNRIYQIDLSAESGLRRLTSTIDIAFILDMSGSMRFPSHLEPVKVNGENLSLLLTQANLNEAFPNDNGPYYIISDPQYTSTVYRITRIDGQWVSSDGSFNDRYVIKGDERFNEPAGSHYKYTIYRDVNPGTTRLMALNASMNKAVNSAKAILQNANGINGDNNLTVAYSRFAYEPFPSVGQYQFLPVSNVNAFNFTDSDTQGGTRQDLALTDALNFAWGDDTTHTKYAILITDGAPVAASGSGVDLAQVMTDIGTNATTLKTQKNVKLITVGLSTRNVQGGSSLLNSIASNGMFYDAESGDELEYILLDILRTIMAEANVCAEITDTVDPAFYPVTEDGTPIEAGYYSMDGEFVSSDLNVEPLNSNYAPYYQWINNNGEWTIKWYNQAVGWKSEDKDWHKTFFVKAKEDFLGGNAMPTNKGSASVRPIAVYNEAPDYNNNNMQAITNPTPTTLDTPYVNVRELAFTQGSSTITVPLGTIVDPLDGENAIKALFNAIKVKKLVSGDTNNMITSPSQMLGTTGDDSATFDLVSVLNDRLVNGTEAEKQDRWAKMLFGGEDNTLKIRYSYGGHYRVGEIWMTLSQETAEGEPGITGNYTKNIDDSITSEINSVHRTEVAGEAVETYTLTIRYVPKDAADREETKEVKLGSGIKWHTTEGGSAGANTKGFDSENIHVINVIEDETTTITVQKEWSDGYANHTNDSVTLKLVRYSKGGTGNGSGTNEPEEPENPVEPEEPEVPVVTYGTLNLVHNVSGDGLSAVPSGFTYTATDTTDSTKVYTLHVGNSNSLPTGTYNISVNDSGVSHPEGYTHTVDYTTVSGSPVTITDNGESTVTVNSTYTSEHNQTEEFIKVKIYRFNTGNDPSSTPTCTETVNSESRYIRIDLKTKKGAKPKYGTSIDNMNSIDCSSFVNDYDLFSTFVVISIPAGASELSVYLSDSWGGSDQTLIIDSVNGLSTLSGKRDFKALGYRFRANAGTPSGGSSGMPSTYTTREVIQEVHLGDGHWSEEITGLVIVDENGDPYYYAIEEVTETAGYTVSYSPASPWMAQEGSVTLTATNTKDEPQTGDLVVRKTVGGNAGDTEKDFVFTIRLSDTTINATYSGLAFTNGVSESFALKHNESKTISGLPVGISYTVEENDYSLDGYETLVASGSETPAPGHTVSGTIIAGETSSASFINNKDIIITTIDITASKQWDGIAAAEQPTAIQFTLKKLVDGEYQTVETDGNPAVITGTSGTWTTASWTVPLYVDQVNGDETIATYKVDETKVYFGDLVEGAVPTNGWVDPDMYDVSDGIVNDGEAILVNTPVTVDVDISKTWAAFSSSGSDWTVEFKILYSEIKLRGSGTSDAQEQFIDLPGYESIILTKNEPTKTISNLPKYRIGSNGNVYEKIYSASEVAYEATNGTDTYIFDGTTYTPSDMVYIASFDHDANEDGDHDYTIRAHNSIPHVVGGDDIVLTVNKKWYNESGTEIATPEGASATFKLKRYVRKDFVEWEGVDTTADDLTVTIGNTAITVKPNQKFWVYVTFKAYNQGSFYNNELKAMINGTTVGAVNSHGYSAVPDTVKVGPFSTTVGGELQFNTYDYFDNGSSFVLTTAVNSQDYAPDPTYEEVFTLPIEGNWTKTLTVPVERHQLSENQETISFYEYYYEEVSTSPSGYYAEFVDENGNQISPDVRLVTDNSITAKNKPIPPFRVTKEWRYSADPDSWPEIRFTLYQGLAQPDGRVSQGDVFVGIYGESYVNIPLNSDNGWSWTCPGYLPATNASGQAVGYYVVESTNSGRNGRSVNVYQNSTFNSDGSVKTYGEQIQTGGVEFDPWIYSYYNNVNNYNATRTDENPAEGKDGGFVGNTGTLTIVNRAPEYIQFDVKKKWLEYYDDGALHTTTTYPHRLKNTYLKIGLMRKTVPVNGTIDDTLVDWEEYGVPFYVGFDQNGKDQCIDPNNFGLVHQSEWFWQINDSRSDKGLPVCGYLENADGTYTIVKYYYITKELGVYQDTNDTPITDDLGYDWYVELLPQAWGRTGDRPIIFPRIVAQDQDRLVNRQASDLLVEKIWEEDIPSNITEVYVKVYASEGENGKTVDFTNDIAQKTDTLSSYGFVSDPTRLKMVGDGVLVLGLTRTDSSVLITGLPLVYDSGNYFNSPYMYWVEEVGYKDIDGNVYLNTVDNSVTETFFPQYDQSDSSGAWKNDWQENPTTQKLKLLTKGKNKLRIKNWPTKDIDVEKKWVDENGTEIAGPWNKPNTEIPVTTSIRFKIKRNNSDYLTFNTSEILNISTVGQRVVVRTNTAGSTEYSATFIDDTTDEADIGNWKTIVHGLQKYDPDGNPYTYTIEELVDQDGKPLDQNDAGIEHCVSTVLANGDHYTIINEKIVNSLAIQKVFSGNAASELTEEQKGNIQFLVTGPNNYNCTFTYGINDAAHSATWTGNTLLVKNIDAGHYTVKELHHSPAELFGDASDAASYLHTWTYTIDTKVTNGAADEQGVEAVVETNGVTLVTIENTYEKAELVITKSIQITNTDETRVTSLPEGEDITFTITPATGLTKNMFSYNEDFVEGELKLTQADGILPNTEYTVTETDADLDGYTRTTTITVNNGTPAEYSQESSEELAGTGTTNIDNYKATIAFVNTYEEIPYGSLKIVKTLSLSDNGTLAVQPTFTFTVKDSSDNYYYLNNGELTLTTTNPASASADGIVTVTAGDAGVTLNDLPVGDYTVTEVFAGDVSIAGYAYTDTTMNPADGVVSVTTGETPVTVTAVNSYTRGSVSVSKTFIGKPDTADMADFKITMSRDDGAAAIELKTTGTQPENVTLTGNGTEAEPYVWTIANLPIGTRVTFEEDGYGIAGYNWTGTVSVNGADATNAISGTVVVDAAETHNVAFKNTYVAGVELPATGGSGTLAYTLGGLALILVAGALWMVRKRRKA